MNHHHFMNICTIKHVWLSTGVSWSQNVLAKPINSQLCFLSIWQFFWMHQVQFCVPRTNYGIGSSREYLQQRRSLCFYKGWEYR